MENETGQQGWSMGQLMPHEKLMDKEECQEFFANFEGSQRPHNTFFLHEQRLEVYHLSSQQSRYEDLKLLLHQFEVFDFF